MLVSRLVEYSAIIRTQLFTYNHISYHYYRITLNNNRACFIYYLDIFYDVD